MILFGFNIKKFNCLIFQYIHNFIYLKIFENRSFMIPLESQEVQSASQQANQQNQNQFSHEISGTDAQLSSSSYEVKMTSKNANTKCKKIGCVLLFIVLTATLAVGVTLIALNGSFKIVIEFNPEKNTDQDSKNEIILQQNKGLLQKIQTQQKKDLSRNKNNIQKVQYEKHNDRSQNLISQFPKTVEQKIVPIVKQNQPQSLSNEVIKTQQNIQTSTKSSNNSIQNSDANNSLNVINSQDQQRLLNKIKEQRVQIQVKNNSANAGRESHPIRRQHGHQPTVYDRPTMGVPEVGKTFNSTIASPQEWYSMQLQMNRLFQPYNDTDCVYKRYGQPTDGGYVICQNFLNQSEGIINLGVSGYDQFGCDVSAQFPQPNYQYDCTDNRKPVCDKNNGANYFELACTRERTEKGSQVIYSLEDLLKSINLINKHIILKIDIEGGEWETFRSFPRQYLDYIDQIIIEIHLDPYFSQIYWGNLQIIEALEEKFINVNLHMNNNGCYNQYYLKNTPRVFLSHAFEATLVNKKLIKINNPTRSYKLHPLNTPNAQRQDCQMRD